jgi:hypothetical protein
MTSCKEQARSGRASKKSRKLKQNQHSAENLYKGVSDVRVEGKGMHAVVHDQETTKKKKQTQINRPSPRSCGAGGGQKNEWVELQ